MSQLYDWRRKVLKKSQKELAEALGYGEQWPTYAAQERGENPLPEEIKQALKAKPYKYSGPFPDEEDEPLTKADLAEFRDLINRKLETILETLRALEEKG
jgi:hypothetical protein